MKIKKILALSGLVCGLLTGCNNDNNPTVSITYEGDEKTALFAIDEVKAALEDNKLKYVDDNGDYQVVISNDSNLEDQEYKISVEGKKISVQGGDRVGLMYGGLQLAEMINLEKGIDKIKDYSETAYTKIRGISCRPAMDLRTPSYTNNGDSTRWNLENTWDLDYWKGLFDIMAKMR